MCPRCSNRVRSAEEARCIALFDALIVWVDILVRSSRTDGVEALLQECLFVCVDSYDVVAVCDRLAKLYLPMGRQTESVAMSQLAVDIGSKLVAQDKFELWCVPAGQSVRWWRERLYAASVLFVARSFARPLLCARFVFVLGLLHSIS